MPKITGLSVFDVIFQLVGRGILSPQKAEEFRKIVLRYKSLAQCAERLDDLDGLCRIMFKRAHYPNAIAKDPDALYMEAVTKCDYQAVIARITLHDWRLGRNMSISRVISLEEV